MHSLIPDVTTWLPMQHNIIYSYILITEALHVYKNKSEALELIKRYKSSRFKVFQNHQDAVSFALRGADVTDMSNGNDSNCECYFVLFYQ